MEIIARTLLATLCALVSITTTAGHALAAPMANAIQVVRNDAQAWGQRLDVLLPGTSATRSRSSNGADSARSQAPATATASRATSTAVDLPINARPITGVVVLPAPSPTASPAPAPAAPPAAQGALLSRAEEPEPGWLQSLQSWILGIARSIGD